MTIQRLPLSISTLFQQFSEQLVGTHAFRTYGNLLGIQLDGAGLRTHDIDFAQFSDINLAIPREFNVDLSNILQRAEMGFVPIPALNHKPPSTAFKICNSDIKLDLLTPLIGKPVDHPVLLPSLKSYAYPLRFLDYLIDNTIQTV